MLSQFSIAQKNVKMDAPNNPAPKVVDVSFLNGTCRYRLECDPDTLVPATSLPFASIRSFWLERSAAPAPAPAPAPVRARREDEVAILGLVEDERGLCVAIRHADEPGRIYVMPCSDARKRFPIQLSLFYEEHIKFDSV